MGCPAKEKPAPRGRETVALVGPCGLIPVRHAMPRHADCFFSSARELLNCQRGRGMILASLVAKSILAASLLVPVAIDRSVQWPPPERGTAMSGEQKD